MEGRWAADTAACCRLELHANTRALVLSQFKLAEQGVPLAPGAVLSLRVRAAAAIEDHTVWGPWSAETRCRLPQRDGSEVRAVGGGEGGGRRRGGLWLACVGRAGVGRAGWRALDAGRAPLALAPLALAPLALALPALHRWPLHCRPPTPPAGAVPTVTVTITSTPIRTPIHNPHPHPHPNPQVEFAREAAAVAAAPLPAADPYRWERALAPALTPSERASPPAPPPATGNRLPATAAREAHGTAPLHLRVL
jgi:hypothetical protein